MTDGPQDPREAQPEPPAPPEPPEPPAPNPLISAYEAANGERFWMLGLQGDRHWPDVVRAVGRPEWLEDERYATLKARFANAAQLVVELNEIFATKPLDEWGEVFDREDVWWAPVHRPDQTVDDPVVRAAGGFVPVPVEGAEPVEMVATPVDFMGTPWSPRTMSPEFAQHTEEVLLELGHDWDRIIELKDLGAIP